MPDTGGRYLSIATLCEKILTEADGAISLIRVFDRYTVPAPSPEGPNPTIPANVVLAFRSGIYRGPATIKFRTISPSEDLLGAIEFPVQFEGDNERGTLLMFNMGFSPQEQGLYWFEVLLDEDLVTRIPLRVIFARMGPVASQAPPQARG
jgi:hypothetical protein